MSMQFSSVQFSYVAVYAPLGGGDDRAKWSDGGDGLGGKHSSMFKHRHCHHCQYCIIININIVINFIIPQWSTSTNVAVLSLEQGEQIWLLLLLLTMMMMMEKHLALQLLNNDV